MNELEKVAVISAALPLNLLQPIRPSSRSGLFRHEAGSADAQCTEFQ